MLRLFFFLEAKHSDALKPQNNFVHKSLPLIGLNFEIALFFYFILTNQLYPVLPLGIKSPSRNEHPVQLYRSMISWRVLGAC
jgi:hypothetical protein